MSKFFIIFLKGLVGLIWLVATVVTTILLSPFILASWISRILDEKQKDKDKNENSSSEDSDN